MTRNKHDWPPIEDFYVTSSFSSNFQLQVLQVN